MGEWDEYCTVCGGPPWVVSDNMVDEEGKPLTTPPLNPADYTWPESFLGLSNKGELIPLASYGSYGRFDIPPDTSSYTFFRIGCRNDDEHTEKAAKGYACHVTCYKLQLWRPLVESGFKRPDGRAGGGE